METIILILVFATVYFLGVFTGIRIQEINLRRREKRLALRRRGLDARTQALDADIGSSRMIDGAREPV